MNQPAATGLFRARTELLPHRVGENWLLLDPQDNQAHTLNLTAYWLWHQCDGLVTAAQLAVRLADEADIPLLQAEADVAAGLAHLTALRLVEEVE